MLSLILLILFLLFMYVILSPIIRVARAVHKAKKVMQNMYDSMGGRQNESQEDEPYRRAEKKIDPNVGEYVEFEEIADDSDFNAANTENMHEEYTTEAQIEDAEWEDVKD